MKNWLDSPVDDGEQCLLVGGIPVVGNTERPLQTMLVDLTVADQEDLVVEVGFGLGFASEAITQRRPGMHIIVEANRMLAQKAAQRFPSAIVVNDLWQNFLRDPADTPRVLVFDPSPELETWTDDAELAKTHLEPIWSTIISHLKPGSRIGAIDPSGLLGSAYFSQHLPANASYKLTAVPGSVVPQGLPWFKNGCAILVVDLH